MFGLTEDKKRASGSETEENSKRLKIDTLSSEITPSYYNFFEENNRGFEAESDADEKLYHQTKMKDERFKRLMASLQTVPKGTQNYKYSKVGDQWFMVPRESAIKTILQNLNDTVLKQRGLHIRGYNGALCRTHGMFCKCSSCEQRRASLRADEALIDSWVVDPMDAEFKKVEKLPVFSDHGVPEMEKGRLKSSQQLSIERCLVLQPFDNDPVWGQGHPLYAAIWFTIGLDSGICEIDMLGVSSEQQRRGMGSILLSAAISIGIEYGITTFLLESSKKGLPLYLSYGFYHDKFDPFLDEDPYEEEYLADIQKIRTFDPIILINEIQKNPYKRLLEEKLHNYNLQYNLDRKIKEFEDCKAAVLTTLENAKKLQALCGQVKSVSDRVMNKLHEISNKALLSKEFLSDFFSLNAQEKEIISKRSDKNEFTLEPMRLG